MRHFESINIVFFFVALAGTICLTADAFQRYSIIWLLITTIGVTGFVVTDCCIRLVEKDLAELLKKAKNKGSVTNQSTEPLSQNHLL